jgi:putative heme iron utilization protein
MTTPQTAADAALLMRRPGGAALGTSLDGAPYVSFVLAAPDLDGSPLLLLSDLAQHTRNIAGDPRVSLLFDETAGLDQRLTGARLTLLGTAVRCDDAPTQAHYVEAHPSATQYAGFGDFHLYRVQIERGHFIAGFGRIEWIAAEALLARPA